MLLNGKINIFGANFKYNLKTSIDNLMNFYYPFYLYIKYQDLDSEPDSNPNTDPCKKFKDPDPVGPNTDGSGGPGSGSKSGTPIFRKGFNSDPEPDPVPDFLNRPRRSG
jgi:hypothetical protein